MRLIRPSTDAIHTLLRAALLEDAPWGDLTSQTLFPADAYITANLVAREPGILCGEDLVSAAFTLTDPSTHTHFEVADGESFAARAILATIQGPARAILQAERVALNLVQRLSGIATMTASYVQAAAGTTTRITDTRKTTPTLRLFERYAVRCGGGHNHRFSLSDAVMVKDNHLAVLMSSANLSSTEDPSSRSESPQLHRDNAAERPAARLITAALLALRSNLPHTTHLEVEVDRLDQLDAILAAHPDTILLDNFSLEDLRSAVTHIAGRALTEASGGVTLDRIPALAATGVDLISVGALTHSARSLDLALDIDIDT